MLIKLLPSLTFMMFTALFAGTLSAEVKTTDEIETLNKKLKEEVIPELVKKISKSIELQNESIAIKEKAINEKRAKKDMDAIELPTIPQLKIKEDGSAPIQFEFKSLDLEKRALNIEFNVELDGSILQKPGNEGKDTTFGFSMDLKKDAADSHSISTQLHIGFDILVAANIVGGLLDAYIDGQKVDPDADDIELKLIAEAKKFTAALAEAKTKNQVLTAFATVLDNTRKFAIEEDKGKGGMWLRLFVHIYASLNIFDQAPLAGVELDKTLLDKELAKDPDIDTGFIDQYVKNFLLGAYLASLPVVDEQRGLLQEGLNFSVASTFYSSNGFVHGIMGEGARRITAFAEGGDNDTAELIEEVAGLSDGMIDMLADFVTSLFDLPLDDASDEG